VTGLKAPSPGSTACRSRKKCQTCWRTLVRWPPGTHRYRRGESCLSWYRSADTDPKSRHEGRRLMFAPPITLQCYFLQVSLCLNRDFKTGVFKIAHDSVQELPSVVATDVATKVASQISSPAQAVGNENQTMTCASSRPALMSKMTQTTRRRSV